MLQLDWFPYRQLSPVFLPLMCPVSSLETSRRTAPRPVARQRSLSLLPWASPHPWAGRTMKVSKELRGRRSFQKVRAASWKSSLGAQFPGSVDRRAGEACPHCPPHTSRPCTHLLQWEPVDSWVTLSEHWGV